MPRFYITSLFERLSGLLHSSSKAQGDIEQSTPIHSFTLCLHPQRDLRRLGLGTAGQIFKVDDHIILKSSHLYKTVLDASPENRLCYASETIFHADIMAKERKVLRVLEKNPHINITEVINTSYDEGIYLRRYIPSLETSEQLQCIYYYQDILCALQHLHKLGITHSDLRVENILRDQYNHAILCDFSASTPIGCPNPARYIPDCPLPNNGLSEIAADATDRFAMGSLIFEMELGVKPTFFVDDNGNLIIPEVQTSHADIDTIIRNAWLDNFSSTSQMLESVNSLVPSRDDGLRSYDTSREVLQDRVNHWRQSREQHHGCVLEALQTEDQLQDLADHYGIYGFTV